jgi:hypothetical protein
MPSGNGPAGDGDEQEREQTASPDWSAAVDEFRDGRHLEIGTNDDDAIERHDRKCYGTK